MILYPYQSDIISRTSANMRRGIRRNLIVSATGSGKTRLASHMVASAARKAMTSWFVVHREELVRQTVDTFREQGIPVGVIAAGHPETDAPVQVCMVQSLPTRLRTPPHMLITDEAHHAAAASYMRIADHCSGAYHIGLTATPMRPDGKPLGAHYDAMVEGPTVAWLIENGYLSRYLYFAPDIPDLGGVKVRAGDYVPSEVEKIMQGKALVANMVKTWRENANGLRTAAFAPTIALSKTYCGQFNETGIASAHIDGKTEPDLRKAYTRAFAEGEIDVLFNVDIISEGYDLAAQAGRDVTIEAVILAAPTKSLPRNRQRLGRGLRRKDRPAVFLDHCGDITRHPLPDAEFKYSLDSGVQLIRPTGQITPISRCMECFSIVPPSAACPVCGTARAVKERQVIYLEGDLKEIKRQDVEAARAKEKADKKALTRRVNAARTMDQLLAIEREMGYANGWARIKFMRRKNG